MRGIFNADCLTLMSEMASGVINLVVADPPFNIGYLYDLYEDKKGYTEYQKWCRDWLSECARVLAPNGSIYVCIGDEYAAELNIIMKDLGLRQRGWIIWRYGFGVACTRKFQRCHTHILWFSKSDDYVFNADSIRVPSDRQLKYKDKRADPRGKIPEDVWNFPRICGTFKSRLKKIDGSTAHSCQMNEDVIRRCILTSTNEGDVVFDPFAGSGTTAWTARQLNRDFITCDISESYCKLTAKRIYGDETVYKMCPRKSANEG